MKRQLFSFLLIFIILFSSTTFSFADQNFTLNENNLLPVDGLNAFDASFLPPDFFESSQTIFTRTSSTVNESEPNNTIITADVIYPEQNVYGYIGNAGDIDYYTVTTTSDGSVNFWIECSGDSTASSNFYYAVYDSSNVLYGSTTASNKLVSVFLFAGTYRIKVYSPDSSYYNYNNQYLFRCKLYEEVDLNVPLYEQEDYTTCAAASVRMILAYHGVNKSESDIVLTETKIASDYNTEHDLWGTDREVDRTWVFVQAYTLDEILYANQISINYNDTFVLSSASLADYQNKILNNLKSGYPVMICITVSDTSYFPYTTGGHYVVISGLTLQNGVYSGIIQDPHHTYCAEYIFNISAIRTYNNAHGGTCSYMICPL